MVKGAIETGEAVQDGTVPGLPEEAGVVATAINPLGKLEMPEPRQPCAL